MNVALSRPNARAGDCRKLPNVIKSTRLLTCVSEIDAKSEGGDVVVAISINDKWGVVPLL